MKNCNLLNNSGKYGGAISWTGSYGKLIDSTFSNNTAKTSNGGAIDWYGIKGTIMNSKFSNNTSKGPGGAVYWSASTLGNGANGTIIDCVFTDNHASNGGAVFLASDNGTLTNSIFINNLAQWGGRYFMEWP